MAALQTLGEVVSAKHFPPLANQSRAYRVAIDGDALTSQSPKSDTADQPESGSGLPESDIGLSRVPNGTDPCPNSDSALPLKTLEKEGEAAGSRRAADPTPSHLQPANSEQPQWIRGPHGPRCRRPEHNVPNPPSCHDCGLARIAAKAEDDLEKQAQQQKRAELAALRTDCPDCGGTNWITDENDEPVKKCDHRRTA